MEFDYTTTTTKTFDATVQNVQDEIVKAGMRVLYVHDVQKTLVEKGFAREPLKIIEFCSAKFANEFLNKDIKIGLCLPMRPIILPQFFPQTDLGERPKEIDQIIQNIIHSVIS